MGNKKKDDSSKTSKKSLLKEIEGKLTETVKGFNKKTNNKKLEKQIRKAGKLLAKSLTSKEQIKVVHKKKVKSPKKEKKVVEKEVAS